MYTDQPIGSGWEYVMFEWTLLKLYFWQNWKYTTKCLDFSWKHELTINISAYLLLHNNVTRYEMWTIKSFKIKLSQRSSAVVDVMLWYSNSVEDRETIGCFFVFQESRSVLKKYKNQKGSSQCEDSRANLHHWIPPKKGFAVLGRKDQIKLWPSDKLVNEWVL